MVLSYEEQKEFEEIKQNNRKEILRLSNANNRHSHQWKMVELDKELEKYKILESICDCGGDCRVQFSDNKT